MTLKRSAEAQGTSAFSIDELTYVYENSNKSNRLLSVTDSSTDYRGYPDTSGIAIPYDDNGNMLSQKDKGMLQIDYNFLNLPRYIKFDRSLSNRSGRIYENTNYLYRADGTKVRKTFNYAPPNPLGTVTQLSSIVTEYLDGFQYESTATGKKGSIALALKFVPTAEGYYNFENNKYIYNYTDHLGNVRLSYFHNGSSIEVLEENNYYPFGLKHEGYNVLAGNPAYKYGYNGKELQTESGMQDYGARFYMADIGRWGVVDPLAEHSQNNTPYHYCSGNPINRLDPNGMCDDPNCSHGGLRKAWDSLGRFLGGWGYANKKEETSKSGNLEVGFLESIGRWLDEPVDSGTAQAAEDLAHSSMPGNFTMPDTNEGVLLSIAVAFGSAMQEANGFRYPRYTPKSTAKFSAKINSRHNLNSTSIAGGKTRSGTFAPKEILDLDIATYNAGTFSNANNGNGDVVINGRIYGIKNEGQTLFPRSGGSPQFQDLSQGQIKAIQLLKTVPANKVDQALKGAGVSNTDINFAKDFINKY